VTGGMVEQRPAPLEAEEETTSVVCRVLEVEPVKGDKLIALASVELVIAGVALTLHGLQVRRGRQAGAEATAVTLPRYRTQAGEWRSAITLPDELRRPIADAVLAACLEAGLVRERFPAAVP
jgi:stage V sporulation protein G